MKSRAKFCSVLKQSAPKAKPSTHSTRSRPTARCSLYKPITRQSTGRGNSLAAFSSAKKTLPPILSNANVAKRCCVRLSIPWSLSLTGVTHYASGHSQRVGQLSRALAEELVLSELEIETAETAGSLMNFGKMLVSRQILTKTVALTTEELQRVRDGIMTSADILSMIDFVGPVVPTLRQVLERMDGTGAPKNLKGEQIPNDRTYCRCR